MSTLASAFTSAISLAEPAITNPGSKTVIDPLEVAHMRRRLFRTLDLPERRLVAIDCGSVAMKELRSTTDRFLQDSEFREACNLVLAIPADSAFATSPAFDLVQSVKQAAFENGFEGKVSWLLIHEPWVELAALKNLVIRQGGKWCASV